VASVLTDQPTQHNASTYWAVLKKRLKDEGADQLLTNCKQLKLKSPKTCGTIWAPLNSFLICWRKTLPRQSPRGSNRRVLKKIVKWHSGAAGSPTLPVRR